MDTAVHESQITRHNIGKAHLAYNTKQYKIIPMIHNSNKSKKTGTKDFTRRLVYFIQTVLEKTYRLDKEIPPARQAVYFCPLWLHQ